MLKHIVLASALTLVVHSVTFAKEAETPVVYSGTAAAPADARQAEIAQLFDRWNAALATGSPDEVTSLYASNAVLEPTLSNQVRTTPEEIRKYFTGFLKQKPQAVINYRQIRILDDNVALDTGVYTFNLTRDGKHRQAQARYTYVYERLNGEWKIINHHSSAMPESKG
ncbi:SgcJ/EcaC family oxidoreductase [Burkholderia sp. Ac-20345]|uniref:SgcJ/EcaC family oxidoreductase n=1 Tax=Burkholderia sp. Ac-20345 TaxID=2703891 RepID=UPI00197BE192|nr:SgcJ/EcaC family oxidoreductase [Burkholderia sp. Ac-20345]MBN3779407.1 SgcJ/EcaC family oxidoreductase [Burkholderia sp. Ac-20345]